MGENENISSKKENAWRTLKLKNDVFEAFEEIKDALKAKHGKKSISNSDTMQFLLYLAKVALELEGNPKLEGVAEPLDYDVLTNLERYSQSIADSLGIPVKHVRGGVLWGILEVANEAIQEDWKKGEYYLKLAQSWVGEYSFHPYEEVSKTIESLIKNIPWTGQRNPHREKIHERLFENVENLVALILLRPNARILGALVLNEIHVGKWERALNFIKGVLLSEGLNKEELIGLIEEFIKNAGKELDPETLEDYVRQLIKAAGSLSIELEIIEIASDFTDVTPFYSEILERGYLFPEHRLEVSRSMIRTASRKSDRTLLDRAIEVAKKELGKLRTIPGSNFEYYRWSIAETLVKAGFWDSVIKLKFDDEIPSIRYYTFMALSLLEKNFDDGWREFEKIAKMMCIEECRYLETNPGVFELFLPQEAEDDIKECLNKLESSSVDFGKFWLSVWGNGLFEINGKIERIDVHCLCHDRQNKVISLFLDERSELPQEVVVKFISRLLNLGAKVSILDHKLMLAVLLSEYDEFRDMARGLVKEAIEEARKEYGISSIVRYLRSPGFVKLLVSVGIDPMEILKSTVKGLIQVRRSKGGRLYPSDIHYLVRGFIAALVFNAEDKDEINEILGLIENGKLLEVFANIIEDPSLRRALGASELPSKQDLTNYFLEAYMEKNGYTSTAIFILEKELKTYLLPYLVDGLLSEGNVELVDRLVSKFGLGWFEMIRGRPEDGLKILLKYRFEKCISEFKKRGKKGEELPGCYRTVLSLLRASRRYLKPEDYGSLGGKYTGRLLAWKVLKTGKG
ncbi:hypothetical protein [Thermococcus sp. JdF3]|uniref:hypothetical protein n=1 Tax=Thermococcus sp. JdF3 TaxID=1638258 RepID=UPI0014388D4C|nr:hypothetical protein [Thermococcus sp. JdF3]NJE02025.1 hypothetical protein [Thermococcus sp. JdF3]